MPFSGASSGGGAGTTLLFDSTLGADTAAIDTGANGIAQTMSTLLVVIVGRTDEAGGAVNVNVKFNNDGGANYTQMNLVGTNATASASFSGAALTAFAPTFHGSGGTAGDAGLIEILVPAYAQTTFNKAARSLEFCPDATGTNAFAIARALSWANTAAVSRIAVSGIAAAKLKAGSRMTIYGLQ